MATRCLHLGLPLQSQTGIQAINSIQLGLSPPQISLGVCGRRGRLTSPATAGSETVTVAFARGDIALGRLGDTEYRRRYGRQNALARYDGLLTMAAKVWLARGRLGWADSDEVEVVLALRNIFLAVRRRRRRRKKPSGGQREVGRPVSVGSCVLYLIRLGGYKRV